MLSEPNLDELMKRSGNRYQTALAIAKRARCIARKRLEKGDNEIKDTVDEAASEIFEERVLVKLKGKYFLADEQEIDLDTVISETVNDILKDLSIDQEEGILEKANKLKETKKEAENKKEKKLKKKE